MNYNVPTRTAVVMWGRGVRFIGKVFLACATPVIIAATLPTSSYADDAPVVIEEITVSARSRDENLQSVPDSISVFTETTIESFGIDDYFDLIRTTPGLSIVEASQSPGIVLLNVRGIGQQLNQDPPIAVIVDGVQVASPAAITQALVDLKRIEVLKGPQGALYGRNAIGGAINITSQSPTDEFSGHLKAGGGTDGYATAEAVLRGPVATDAAAFSLVGKYTDYDGDFYNQILNTATNPLNDWFIKGRLEFDIASVGVDLRYNHSETENAGYNAVVLPGGNAGDFTQSPMSGRVGDGAREIDEASVTFTVESGIGTWRAITAFVDSMDESGYDLDQQPVDLIDLALQRTNINALSQEIRLTSSSDRRARYTVGAYFLDSNLERITDVTLFPLVTGAPVPISLLTDTDQDNTVWALFGQLNYDLTDSTELTLAARYDYDDKEQTNNLTGTSESKEFDSLQPKVSLAHQISESVMVYGTYAEGFRSGGFNQPTPSFPLLYDAEESQNFELGLKSQFLKNRLQLNAAAFHTVLNDQQVTLVDVQNSGAQGIVNIDKTEFSGIEFQIVGRLSETVLISAGATKVDSEITEFSEATQYIGNNSPYAPELTWVVAIDYAPSINEKWDLSVHADYSSQSGMYYEYFGSIEQPSFGLLNCRVALVRDNFRIEAWGENLSDERYYTDVASNNVTGGLGDLGIRGRGIRYGINLTFEY